MIPGEYILAEENITANDGRDTVELTVANTGDRPIQVGSHFHFFEGQCRTPIRSGEGVRYAVEYPFRCGCPL